MTAIERIQAFPEIGRLAPATLRIVELQSRDSPM
jgi:hypothetical protein